MKQTEKFGLNLNHVIKSMPRGSSKRIAEKAGCSTTYISQLCTGNLARNPSLELAADISDEIGVPLTMLLLPHSRFLREYKKLQEKEAVDASAN